MDNRLYLAQIMDNRKLEWSSSILKTISHPKRLEIVDLLGKRRRLTVTEIYNQLNVDQAVASQHLILLKNKGILDSEKKGKSMFYFLAMPELLEVIDTIVEASRNSVRLIA